MAAEAALTRLLLTALVALTGTILGYLALGVVVGVSAGWSREVAIDQAIGLAMHAAVVFVRGVLPTALALGSACWFWRHRSGSDPGAWATLALALVLAAGVTLLILTSAIAGWPRLDVKRAPDALATVALLGAAAAGAELLSRRWRRRAEPG